MTLLPLSRKTLAGDLLPTLEKNHGCPECIANQRKQALFQPERKCIFF